MEDLGAEDRYGTSGRGAAHYGGVGTEATDKT